MTPNFRAALLMMASMAAFTLNDTFVKLAGSDLPLGQILVLRGVLVSILFLMLSLHMGALRVSLPRRDWHLILWRCASEAAAAYFFLTALFNMPLANVTAVLQVLPLTVTLGAALFLGEPVGWKRAGAIALGFAGMLLIVRPGPDGFSLYSIYVLAAVACVTVRDLTTRMMSTAVPSMLVALSAAVSVTLFGALYSVGEDWQPLTPALTVMAGASGLFVFGGYLFSVMVMRAGDVSFTAPFRYTGLVWALVLGWLVFGHWPEPLTLLGAAVVVGSGLFTLYRERVAGPARIGPGAQAAGPNEATQYAQEEKTRRT